MRLRKTEALPARLEAGRRRFERWRRTRQGHSRIPEPLWMSAVKLAGAYGLCRTARTLGLDYNALKRRAASARPGDSPGGKTAGAKAARQRTAAQETATAFTVFTVVDALTRVAARLKYAGDRVEADEKAGKLLALVA